LGECLKKSRAACIAAGSKLWKLCKLDEANVPYYDSALDTSDGSPGHFEKPFAYADEGQPDLWALPGHGWHENLLKAQPASSPPVEKESAISGTV